jgi:cholera toxin transcriptional activator
MSAPAHLPRRIRFGVFEADLESGELRKQGIRIRLQEQPFQVLAVLLERRGELVSREELRQRLWPSDTFVDFDHGLNTAVNKLREALGDSASAPRYIETLARKGYRYIGPAPEMVGEAPVAAAVMQSGSVAAPVSDPSTATFSSITQALTEEEELPSPPRVLVRWLFALAQVMYLAFYIAALAQLGEVHRVLRALAGANADAIEVAVIATAAIGIPVRLFFLCAAAFDYRGVGRLFKRVFPILLVLDLLWALAPFLMLKVMPWGLALAACAALLFVPFAQRTLMRMGYSR